MTADQFNAKYPIGSRFTYGGQTVVTEVLAWAIKGVAYVKVSGSSNPVNIASLTPIVAKRTVEQLELDRSYARQYVATIQKQLDALKKLVGP